MSATIHFDGEMVTRTLERAGPIETMAENLPAAPAKDWPLNWSRMAPAFWNPGPNADLCHVQTWGVHTAGRTMLVDAGIVNDRPQAPVSLELALGHTPDSFVVHLRAGVEALSAGDLLSGPMQLLYPGQRGSSKQQHQPSVVG